MVGNLIFALLFLSAGMVTVWYQVRQVEKRLDAVALVLSETATEPRTRTNQIKKIRKKRRKKIPKASKKIRSVLNQGLIFPDIGFCSCFFRPFRFYDQLRIVSSGTFEQHFCALEAVESLHLRTGKAE